MNTATAIDFLNMNTGAIQVVTTVILVFITAIYSYFTYRMARIMEKQVAADIQVSSIVLGSNFSEDWFKERLGKQPEQINNDSSFQFKLL